MPGVERICSSSLSYKRVTTEDIERLLGRCPNKQCALDPVPTWLVKAAGATMTAILTKLVNSSLDSAMFPWSMKHAIVTPIIKKHGMGSSSLSSYRPISNLPFVSKLLERIVAGQLTTYLNTNHLLILPTHQSAYRRYHSTETALLAICNDALIAADRAWSHWLPASSVWLGEPPPGPVYHQTHTHSVLMNHHPHSIRSPPTHPGLLGRRGEAHTTYTCLAYHSDAQPDHMSCVPLQ